MARAVRNPSHSGRRGSDGAWLSCYSPPIVKSLIAPLAGISMSAIQSPITSLNGVGTFVDNDGTKTEVHPAMSAPSRLVIGMPWKTIPMKI